MNYNEEIADQIDKYILGQMSDTEKASFEQQMHSNPELAQEVNESRAMLSAMEDLKADSDLREIMSEAHDSMPKKEKTKSRSLFWPMTAAASIALLLSFSFMYTMGVFDKKQIIEEHGAQLLEVESDLEQFAKNNAAVKKEIKEIKEGLKEPLKLTSATCFPLTDNGYLVTSYHTIKRARRILIDGIPGFDKKLHAKSVFVDRKNDFAILLIEDTSFTSFGELPYSYEFRSPELGEYVFSLGYPKKDIVFGEGSISSLSGYKNDTTEFQISIPANPGNSGSPLFDQKGYLLGVIKRKNSKQENATYALKSTYIYQQLDSVASDTTLPELKKPRYNRLKWKTRTKQVRKLKDFVFRVSVLK